MLVLEWSLVLVLDTLMLTTLSTLFDMLQGWRNAMTINMKFQKRKKKASLENEKQQQAEIQSEKSRETRNESHSYHPLKTKN